MKATCHIIFCDCQSNSKNIFAKIHENISKLSQEIENNTENIPRPSPPPKKNLKSPQQRVITPKFLSLATIRVYQSVIKNVCAKFHKKRKSSQEIEKNTTKQTKKYPKWPPVEEEMLWKCLLVQ